MGTLVMLFLSLPKIRSSSFVVQTVVGLTVLIPFAILFLNMSGDTIASLGRNSTLTGRTQVWERALELITHPISEVQPGINQAHNGYLEIFLNLGWCGIALLAILIASGYRNVIAAFRLHQDGGLLKIALFAVAISYNFTEAGFKMMNPMWIAFLWATTRTPRVATVPSRTGRTAAALRENASDSPYALEWNSCFRPRNDGNGKPGEVTSRADPLQTV
jgi:O-antigen ligase